VAKVWEKGVTERFIPGSSSLPAIVLILHWIFTMALLASEILSEINPFAIIDPNDIKGSFVKLSKIWHPDVSTGNHEVFTKITHMRDLVLKIENGEKEVPHVRIIKSKDKGIHRIVFHKKYATDTGFMYLCKNFVVFAESKNYESLFNPEIPKFENKHKVISEKILPFLPHQFDKYEEEDFFVYVIPKKPDVVPLRTLLDYLKTPLEPVHAAWVVSRLLNLASYLAYTSLSHLGFNETNIFVNPINHTAYLLGGWRLATPFGEKIKALPQFTMRYCPRHCVDTKKATPILDLETIKALARTLFGDVNGRNFSPGTPQSIKNWLIQPSLDKAADEYASWEKALLGFGPRKFIQMDFSNILLYRSLLQ